MVIGGTTVHKNASTLEATEVQCVYAHSVLKRPIMSCMGKVGTFSPPTRPGNRG